MGSTHSDLSEKMFEFPTQNTRIRLTKNTFLKRALNRPSTCELPPENATKCELNQHLKRRSLRTNATPFLMHRWVHPTATWTVSTGNPVKQNMERKRCKTYEHVYTRIKLLPRHVYSRIIQVNNYSTREWVYTLNDLHNHHRIQSIYTHRYDGEYLSLLLSIYESYGGIVGGRQGAIPWIVTIRIRQSSVHQSRPTGEALHVNLTVLLLLLKLFNCLLTNQ